MGTGAPRTSRLNLILTAVLGIVGALIIGMAAVWFFLRRTTPTAAPTLTPAATAMAESTQTPTGEPRLRGPTWTVEIPPTATLRPTSTPEPSPTPAPTRQPHAPQDTGGRIVFTRKDPSYADASSEIYVLSVLSGTLTRLTANNDVDHIPSWSPDGARVAYASNRGDNYDIYTMNADGSDQQLLIGLPAWDDYARWSPDGDRIAFVTTDQLDGVWNSEVFVATIGGGRERATFNTGRDEWPAWSPDGEWLAASSDRDGNMDIYVFRADGSSVANLTSDPEDSIQPAWSPDGEWIAFARGASGGEMGVGTDIWLARRDSSDFRQLTFDGFALGPAWSPDGQYVVYSRYWDSNGDGKTDLGDAADLVAVATDGSGATFVLTEGPEQDTSPDWGP